MAGVVHAPDFHKWGRRDPETVEDALRDLEDVIRYEGGHTIAAFIIETVVGTNGILIPPDGYMQGVRELCDRHGILLIADEVMSGFGRTGRWFAVDHWGVVPDIITMAKGLTGGYVQLGAVGMRRSIAEHFRDKVFFGGLTYNSHPLACADGARRDPDLRGRRPHRAGRPDGPADARAPPRARGEAPVRRGDALDRPVRHCRAGPQRASRIRRWRRTTARRTRWPRSAGRSGEGGLYTFVRWNGFMTNPPLTISEDELREGFAIIDRALEATDAAVA